MIGFENGGGEFVETSEAIDPNILPVGEDGFRTDPETGRKFEAYDHGGVGHFGGDFLPKPPAEIEVPENPKE